MAEGAGGGAQGGDGEGEGDGPPFLRARDGGWRNVYALVLGTLAAVIALLSLFTWIYR